MNAFAVTTSDRPASLVEPPDPATIAGVAAALAAFSAGTTGKIVVVA